MSTVESQSLWAGMESEALQFVRWCLRVRWETEALEAARRLTAESPLDWDQVERIAIEGRLGPLLYRTIRGSGLVPESVESAMRSARHGQALRDRVLREELGQILQRLRAATVDVLLLKGAALSHALYGMVGLRPMGDMDLLVRRETVPVALDILREMGYLPAMLETRTGADLAYENEIMLCKDGLLDFAVEVHWSLFDSPFHQKRLPMGWFWDTSREVEIGGMPVRILGNEGLLLHLCGHLVLHHSSEEHLRLLWLHDVTEVVHRCRDDINWKDLLPRAQTWGLLLPLQRILGQVAREWGAPIPAAVLAQLDALSPIAEELEVVAGRTAPRRTVAQRFWSDLASMTGWRRRIGYAWTSLFPSPGYMRHRYRIPHPLLTPIYYPYRWFIGLRSML